MGLCFGSGEPMIDGYTYSDMAGDNDSRKSISGFLMTFAGGGGGGGGRILAIQVIEMYCIIYHRC